MRSPPEGGISVLTPPSTIAACREPSTPVVPKVMGPTVERASMRTAERSGSRTNRPMTGSEPTLVRRLRAEARGGPGVSGPLGPSRRALLSGGRPPSLLVGVSVRPLQAPPPHGGRRHRRPGHVGLGHPALLDLRQHGVDRARRQVAPDDVAEVGVFLPDDPHPDPQHPLPQWRHRIDPPGLAGLLLLRRHLDEAVPFELGEGPVDRRTVHVAEPELRQTWHEAVAVSRLLGQEEQDRRQHEAAGRGELEPRHPLGCRALRTALFGPHAATILAPRDAGVNGSPRGMPRQEVQKTLIYTSRGPG